MAPTNHQETQTIFASAFLNTLLLAIPLAILLYGLFGEWQRALRTTYLLLAMAPMLCLLYWRLRQGKSRQVLIGLSLLMWLGLSVQIVTAATLSNPVTPLLIYLAAIGSYAQDRLLSWLNPCLCTLTILGVGVLEKLQLLPSSMPPSSLGLGLGSVVAIGFMWHLSRLNGRQLAKLNSQLHLALNAGKMHCFTLNRDRQTLLVNDETSPLLGCKPGEQPFNALTALSAESCQGLIKVCGSPVTISDFPPLDLQLTGGPGQGRWFRLFFSSQQSQAPYLVGAMQDINEQKQTDLAKENFTAMVSHELRTPLTSLLGSLSLLRGLHGKDMPESAQQLLDMAHRGGERLAALVNEILDYFKLQAGRMPVNARMTALCPDIEQAIESVSALLQERQLTLHRDGFCNDLHAWLDSSRTQQVVINLLSNAIKFSPPGTALWMSMHYTGQHLRFSLRDSGPGIPEDFQQRIFEPFTQANMSNTREGNSTGLGLAFSQQLMHLMGGELSFSSPPGEGATFHMDLLRQPPQMAPGQSSPG